jgi:hypothetical protein
LAQWFRARTENARGTRKTMIVALARKLLIALWRLVMVSDDMGLDAARPEPMARSPGLRPSCSDHVRRAANRERRV